jgi:hypothetical protein
MASLFLPIPLLLLSLFAVAGCSSDGEDDGSDEGALTRVGQDQVPTAQPVVNLLDGYTTLFDLKHSSCVKPSDSRAPSVGSPQQKTTIQFVQSDTDLAKELGIDATLTVKAPAASGAASASLVQTFKNSTSSVHYLINSTQSYVASNGGGVTLNDDAAALLRTNPDQFAKKCGDRFVSSVTYEARVVALLTFETADEERALTLKGEISAGGGVGPAQVDGSVKSNLSNTAKRTDVRTTMTVIAQGFSINSTDALLGIGGTVDDKLKRIDEVGKQMAASLADDRQKDTSGLAANNGRSAIPTSINLSRYTTADNAPDEAPDSLQKIDDKFRKTEAFLRAFGALRVRMNHAYKDEVADFQTAGPEEQASFNLMPPAAPKRSSAELLPIASQWAQRFRGGDGGDAGTDLAKIDDVMERCLENAKNGAFSDCHPSDVPTTLPEYKAATSAIDEYLQTARIVRMRMYIQDVGATAAYESALSKCSKVDGKWVDRLPSASEAALIAPAVAGFGGGSNKSIWTADTAACTFKNSGMSFYSNPIDGTDASTGCDAWGLFSKGARSVICVPQSGPLGKRPDL